MKNKMYTVASERREAAPGAGNYLARTFLEESEKPFTL